MSKKVFKMTPAHEKFCQHYAEYGNATQEGKIYHYTYQTTNLINGKYYIGIHSTNNLDDGYLGSGILLKKAIKKYGKVNFNKTILCFFDTREELVEEEKFLITNEFVNNDQNYNLGLGGNGGAIQSKEGLQRLSDNMTGEKNHRYGTTPNPETIEKLKKRIPWNKGLKTPDDVRLKQSISGKNKKVKSIPPSRKGMKHSDETKRKIGEANKNNYYQILTNPNI